MASNANSVQDVRQALLAEMEAKAATTNSARTGVGTRVRVGQTRGRSPQVVTWEAFDEAQPDTLPTSISMFMEITKVQDEPAIVAYLIDGYNSAQYAGASDSVLEFVNPTWPAEVAKNFRLVVKNYAAATGVSIEDAANLIRPGIDKAHAK